MAEKGCDTDYTIETAFLGTFLFILKKNCCFNITLQKLFFYFMNLLYITNFFTIQKLQLVMKAVFCLFKASEIYDFKMQVLIHVC